MKMKVLDCALLGLLASMASADAAAQAVGGQAAVHCDGTGCSDAPGSLLMQVRTRGERQPVTSAGEQAGSQALQPDRRVTVSAGQGGRAHAVGKWSLALPDGGVVWATEDPAMGTPELAVSAPSVVPFDGKAIAGPVRFAAYSNYPAFIERAEVLVFRVSDTDLVAPVARIELPVAAVSEVMWDARLPEGLPLRVGDEFLYLVRAHGADGSVDETYAQRFRLVPADEASRSAQLLRDAAARASGTSLDVGEAESRRLLEQVATGNGLRQQNIPLHGSRIRIRGQNLPRNASVTINGRAHPLDAERKLAAEFLVPPGQHAFALRIDGEGYPQPVEHAIEVEASGRYLFAVAIADLTVSGNRASGSIEPLAGDEQFEKDLLVEGRLGFYLKGKIKGKYLVTAQADTREREVDRLFSGFRDADPQDIFRRLDPDQYYPVYGDDSTTVRDVDTMGRLYVRVDWDKNQALWGNFQTGFTGTEYGQYQRSLYGAAAQWRSRATTALGEPVSELRGFASKAESVPGHSEFTGTGGSLYYLRHTDLLPGSATLVVETRDPTTGRVEQRRTLVEGADYELDAYQGRVLLHAPLTLLARAGAPTLTRDMPLDGLVQVLLVDYEYVPTGFNADEVTAGLRARHWFGGHFALGGTYVEEQRAGEDYSLAGVDLTLQAGRGTYLRVEHSRTEATSAPVFVSHDGGLSFTRANAAGGRREGEATAAEARANLRELGWTGRDWTLGAWWREVDAGYSVARHDTGEAVREYGAELAGQPSDALAVYARFSRAERGSDALVQAQATVDWRLGEGSTLSAELRRVEEQRAGADATGLLAALQFRQQFGASLELAATVQATLDDDGGAYADNDSLRLGGKYLFGDLSSVGLELSHGDRGDAAEVSAEYRLAADHAIYASYTHGPDGGGYDPLFNPRRDTGWTLGQRWRLSSRANLFNESQWLKAPTASGLAHTFGMDFYPAMGWTLGFTLEEATLEGVAGETGRRAVSINGGHVSNASQWRTTLEWRRDTGVEQREQWATSNSLSHRFSDDLRMAARFNYSRTRDQLDPLAGARFVEGNVGLALRPHDSARWALFARYTYLYDLSTLAQVGDGTANYDQRSQVLSVEGVYRLDANWEVAAKLAQRAGEVRMGRMQGEWVDSRTRFAAGQLRYELPGQWHALGEFRLLDVRDGGARSGYLLGVDRDLGRNFRVGIGYNFTDFSDDLTDFDYDHRGFFLNLVGRY